MKSLWIAALASALSQANASSPPVNIALKTSWNATHILNEILETVALEDPALFFPTLDIMTHPRVFDGGLENHSPEEIYEQTLQTMRTGHILSEPGARPSFERAVSMRAATPRIEAFLSHYAQRFGNDPPHPQANCDSWVDWYGTRLCSPENIVAALGYKCQNWRKLKGSRICDEDKLEQVKPQPVDNPVEPVSLSFDHVYPSNTYGTNPALKTAILYGDLNSENFYGLHHILYKLAAPPNPAIRYVFRHAPSTSSKRPAAKAFLSGYGVALDLKKMDYLALDDRQQAQKGTSGAQAVLADDEKVAVSAEDPILALLPEAKTTIDLGKPLSSEALAALGFKTSQLILDSKDPLETLTLVSQSFPKYAASISHRQNHSDDLVLAIGGNMQRVQSGANMVWLNGKPIPATEMNPFALLRRMRKERHLMSSLTSTVIGLSRSQALQVLTHPLLSEPSANQVLEGMFDASDRPEEGGLILWLNDLEKDKEYERLPVNLENLMKPSNQMPAIRRNIHNVILALDLSQSKNVATLNMVASIVQRGIPVRFGIVPIVETPEAAQVARFFYHLYDNFEPIEAIGFHTKAADPRRPTISVENLRRLYEAIKSTEEAPDNKVWEEFDDVTSSLESESIIKRLTQYAERLSLKSELSKNGHLFVNGKYSALNDDWLRSLQGEIGQHMRFLQEAIFAGELVDAEGLDVSTYFYDLPTTARSRNANIYPSSSESSALRIVPLADLGLALPWNFISPPGSTNIPLSIWVVGDLESEKGISLVREGLQAMGPGSSFRLSCVHAPTGDGTPKISSALLDVLFSESSASPADVLQLIDRMTDENLDAEALLKKIWGDSKAITLDQIRHLESKGKHVIQKIGFAPGDVGLIVNGRIIGPLPAKTFTASDFHALASYEKNKRIAPIQEALNDILTGPPKPESDSEDDDADVEEAEESKLKVTWDMIARVSSIILADQIPEPGMDSTPMPRSRPYAQLTAEKASFSMGNNETSIFNFGIILNPMSEAAQKYSSLLDWLSDDVLLNAVVYLNPPHQVEELPLKRFYRYNLPRTLEFAEDHDISESKVQFTGLPRDPIYTLAMDVPQSWLVRPHESLHDLDNIQLSALGGSDATSGVNAVFSLDYLVVEGHARDVVSSAPPRGLQLQMTSAAIPVADTQVVANLGYFQLKAKPGVFQLEIRPGRGEEIFEMTSAGNEGFASPSVEEAGVDVTVTDFEGITLYPVFRRKEGMENEDVLTSETEETSFFENLANKVGSVFGSSKSKSTTDVVKRQADINIFTVASGLLYERFASIMILSVLKNTDKTVKFWFIENFLSPSFLEFIPHFAEEYGFEYELVTYKWPSWLRMPSEKQRIIWGYKILFLDVLFPMDLKKVIFVDADQIVRADLHELVTLDLHGAPYGYTPMGDDSEDMDGFRFWKQGYWKEALAGKPYHISALYVVDLIRFRQIAAGDRLRGQYQGLSADPNSLANLDQDLPNNMQREVPIFSLPEDWLWCETWCSKDRLHRAKTIDLCQNPKTKEPKLSRARQIPEWEKYDSEIATFARKLAEAGRIRSSAAAENVDALAGEAAVPIAKEDAVHAEKAEVVHEEL